MNLFLLKNDRSVDKVIGLPAYVAGKDLILCFNYLVYLRLKKEKVGHNFKFIEELLTQEDYDILHSATDRFAAQWYKMDGVDQSVFCGVSFGDILQVMFSRTYKVTLTVKCAELIRKAIKEYGDIETIYFDFKDFTGEIAHQFGATSVFLPVEQIIPEPIFTNSKKRNSQEGVLKIVIKGALKDVIKFLINIFTDIKNKVYSDPIRKNIYFFNYPNLNMLLKYNTEHFLVPDLDNYMLRREVLFSGLTFMEFGDIRYRFKREEFDFLRTLKQKFEQGDGGGRFGCDFIVNGIDYGDLYRPIIKDMVSNIVPDLLKFFGQVRKGLKRFDINTVIVRDCLEEKTRTVLEACKIEKVKTVYVDHGIQGHAVAQKAATEALPDELITAGMFSPYDHMRSIALGNPCMDFYPKEKRKEISSIKNVLFLSFEDNFYARLDRFSYQERYYEEAFSSFEELLSAGINIFFRPHSLDKEYYEYLFKFLGVDSSKIQYAMEGSFRDLIYEMDLLVTNISTCFFEAQAAGVPTIFMEPHFNVKAVLAPFNGVNEEVLRVSTKEELVKLILSNQKDPKYLNAFLENFLNQYAPLYMGQLDGMASKRIMEYVCQKENL